jgi:hypothetical protein
MSNFKFSNRTELSLDSAISNRFNYNIGVTLKIDDFRDAYSLAILNKVRLNLIFLKQIAKRKVL